jgi:uncharacterized protein
MFKASQKFMEKLEAETETESKLSRDHRTFLDAARTGDVDKVRQLLGKRVPVDVREDFAPSEYYQQSEQTALMYAAGGGHLEVVRVLLKAGATVSAIDKMFSREYGGEKTALHYAAQQANVAVVEELLNAGADVNALTKNAQNRGYTPLIYALQRGHRDVAQLLIKRGTNLTSKVERKQAMSPLWALLHESRDDVPDETIRDLFLMLLDAGADPNSTGDANQTALFGVAGTDCDNPKDLPVEIANALLKKLLKAGAKPDWLEKFGSTPLESALIRKNPEAIKLLLEAGSNVNQLFKRGTALDIIKGDIKLCEEDLKRLKKGPKHADPKLAESVKGQIATSEGELRRCKEIEEILRKAGAKKKSAMKI